MPEEEKADDVCAVCLDPVGLDQEMAQPTSCGHEFHRGCLEFWAVETEDTCHACWDRHTKGTCPTCRRDAYQMIVTAPADETGRREQTSAQFGNPCRHDLVPVPVPSLMPSIMPDLDQVRGALAEEWDFRFFPIRQESRWRGNNSWAGLSMGPEGARLNLVARPIAPEPAISNDQTASNVERGMGVVVDWMDEARAVHVGQADVPEVNPYLEAHAWTIAAAFFTRRAAVVLGDGEQTRDMSLCQIRILQRIICAALSTNLGLRHRIGDSIVVDMLPDEPSGTDRQHDYPRPDFAKPTDWSEYDFLGPPPGVKPACSRLRLRPQVTRILQQCKFRGRRVRYIASWRHGDGPAGVG